jgi:hypothetical protein
MNNDRYPEKYGAWAGNREGTKPDYTRCCEEVGDTSTRWPSYHQCSRKRGFGPDQAYCRQHDPAAVEERRKAAEERSNQDYNRWWLGVSSPRFRDALKQIAEGHNDPRGLAQEVLAAYEEKVK